MKLKVALKKFNFLKRLCISDITIEKLANHLAMTLKGTEEVYVTPLAKNSDPIIILYEWEIIFKKNSHKMNGPLLDLERANRSKFGPRSQAVPWAERMQGLIASYKNQDDNHIPIFKYICGDASLLPISLSAAVNAMKKNTSSGFPLLVKKKKALTSMLPDFDENLKRKDPCLLFTRTTEKKKTRNVWGYPLADTLYEMMFYIPLLELQKTKFYRAALVSPDVVAQRITGLILDAMSSDKLLYSVDFAGFDASVKYQYIILAFDYIKSCFATPFHPAISYICNRMYSIGIVTPTGIYHGNHGIPSGSTFTNEVDSIVQLGIASTCSFIRENECLVQGDDGVYSMLRQDIADFENAFKLSGLTLEKSKSLISSDSVMFCQNLYHIDYINEHGLIGGIYPTYRALNRILFQERYVNLQSIGIRGKDYFGIRCLSILENCKYHPLFEDLVRYVLSKEKYSLDISDDSLTKYCAYLNLDKTTVENLNHQYGTQVMGIKGFEAYKIAKRILAEQEEFTPKEVCGVIVD